MDARNVRVLRPREGGVCEPNTVYIDESARYALHTEWGGEITILGRQKFNAKIGQLQPDDCDGQICRMDDKLMDDLYICVGDEVLLYGKE